MQVSGLKNTYHINVITNYINLWTLNHITLIINHHKLFQKTCSIPPQLYYTLIRFTVNIHLCLFPLFLLR